MKPYIDVFVSGLPVPQGSLRAGRNGRLYYSNATKLRPWREKITGTVMGALPKGHTAIDDAMRVRLTFYFPRPKSTERIHKVTAPDLDKLFRAVGDGLTDAQLFSDDSRIVALEATKWYSDDEALIGVRIEAWRFDEQPPLPF